MTFYYEKNNNEQIQFEGEFELYDETKKYAKIYTNDPKLISEIIDYNNINIIIISSENSKMRFNMIAKTKDFINYELLSNGKPEILKNNEK